MAAIDKWYTNSLEEYKSFKDWAKDKSYTTPRGIKVKVSDYIYAWDDKNFFDESGKPVERPVFNSPIHFDNYLYHECPLKFVRNWLDDRYRDDGYRKGNPEDIRNELKRPEYEMCRKVTVEQKGLGECPYGAWMIEVEYNGGWCWYNENYDFWLLPDENDEWTTNMARSKKSVRAIIRKIIKKWRLPVDCTVKIYSGLYDDEWILKTK